MKPTVNEKKAAPRGKEQVKAALIDAGIKLFSERGMSSVSVRDLADEAGVNHSLLFRHFGDKKALIKAVFEQRFKLLGEYNESMTTDGDVMLEASIRAVMQDQALWRLMTFAALEGEFDVLHFLSLTAGLQPGLHQSRKSTDQKWCVFRSRLPHRPRPASKPRAA